MKFEVTWKRDIVAEYAADAAAQAVQRLNGEDPEDFVFLVKPKKQGAHRVKVTVDPKRKTEQAKADVEPDKILEDIFQAAKAHGEESEPEHEVGDLQEALSIAWAKLSPEAKREVHAELANGTIFTWMEIDEE
jgi:hypothetical protein